MPEEETPNTLANLPSTGHLRFWAHGDNGAYRLMAWHEWRRRLVYSLPNLETVSGQSKQTLVKGFEKTMTWSCSGQRVLDLLSMTEPGRSRLDQEVVVTDFRKGNVLDLVLLLVLQDSVTNLVMRARDYLP